MKSDSIIFHFHALERSLGADKIAQWPTAKSDDLSSDPRNTGG